MNTQPASRHSYRILGDVPESDLGTLTLCGHRSSFTLNATGLRFTERLNTAGVRDFRKTLLKLARSIGQFGKWSKVCNEDSGLGVERL